MSWSLSGVPRSGVSRIAIRFQNRNLPGGLIFTPADSLPRTEADKCAAKRSRDRNEIDAVCFVRVDQLDFA